MLHKVSLFLLGILLLFYLRNFSGDESNNPSAFVVKEDLILNFRESLKCINGFHF